MAGIRALLFIIVLPESFSAVFTHDRQMPAGMHHQQNVQAFPRMVGRPVHNDGDGKAEICRNESRRVYLAGGCVGG